MSYADEPETTSELGQLILWLFPIPSLGLLLTASGGSEGEFGVLYELSIVGLLCGIFVLLMIYGASAFAGQDRQRLSYIFGPSIRIMMIALAGSVLCQAGLFVFGIFAAETSLIGRVHAGLLLAISIGAIVACFTLVAASIRILKISPMDVRGELIADDQQSEIWSLVKSSAKKLQSTIPDNIVVGLEPNFYVTNSDVRLIGEDRTISGSTLYVSSSLMRILTTQELLAVVGHELGHFRGNDLNYTTKFAPTYSRLGHALHGLSAGLGNAGDLAKIPALAALSTCLNRFAVAERAIGREREFAADKAGAEVSSSKALATALLKVSAYSSYWHSLIQMNISELEQGRLYTNLSRLFGTICEGESKAIDWDKAIDSLMSSQQPHPIDTHPPLSQRVAALGISTNELTVDSDMMPTQTAISLISEPESYEVRLSSLEAQWLEAIGAVRTQVEDSSVGG